MALTEYAKSETNHEFYNIEVEVEATSSPGWKKTIRINETNIPNLWVYEVRLHRKPGWLCI